MSRELSIEEVISNLKRVKRVMTEEIQVMESTFSDSSKEKMFANLVKAVLSVGQDKPAKPLLTPEEYLRFWQEYLTGSRKVLPYRAIRYLCWSSEVAATEQFIKYIENNGFKIFPQQIQGLVRSCHDVWSPYIASGYIRRYVFNLIKNYDGPNRILVKWKSNLPLIFCEHADLELGKKFFHEKKTIKEVCEEWFIDQKTQYCINAVEYAAKFCIEEVKKGDKQAGSFLIDNLINWQGWPIEGFKKQIENALLNNDITNNDLLKNKLITLILSTAKDKLGDPRLPTNSRKWLGISDAARIKLIQWLSKEDIIFFFEHVLPYGEDKHGRKNFWLRYVSSFQQTRALLCSDDEIRLASTINRNRDKIGYFGKIKGKNSAFLLDFGNVIAIEFSKVGAIYLYSREQFNRIVPEFWSTSVFLESNLKRPASNLAWISHSGNNWEYRASSELASLGIRPSK